MKPEWKGTATESEIVNGALSIYITRDHMLYPGTWVVVCEAARFSHKPLRCETAEEAKEEAVRIVRERLANLLKAANELPA